MINGIVALNKHNIIATKDGVIPWKIPQEITFFKETTLSHVVIMGRKTFDSLPDKFKPLSGRLNIVVSRSMTNSHNIGEYGITFYKQRPLFVFDTLEKAIERSQVMQPGREVFVIGGGEIYNYAIVNNLIEIFYVSEVNGADHITEGIKFPVLEWEREQHGWFSDFTVYKYTKPSSVNSCMS